MGLLVQFSSSINILNKVDKLISDRKQYDAGPGVRTWAVPHKATKKKKQKQKTKKTKKTCFTGGRTFQVWSVGGTFFFSGGKDDSPEKR